MRRKNNVVRSAKTLTLTARDWVRVEDLADYWHTDLNTAISRAVRATLREFEDARAERERIQEQERERDPGQKQLEAPPTPTT